MVQHSHLLPGAASISKCECDTVFEARQFCFITYRKSVPNELVQGELHSISAVFNQNQNHNSNLESSNFSTTWINITHACSNSDQYSNRNHFQFTCNKNKNKKIK